ncbi:MAG: hypothetical protein IK088_09985, partial [Lachnospiraceae bacterium]|nr:hypothetical protein [Lachnospiraceae bacterium]
TIGTGMTQVTLEMLRRWEISEEELHQLAEVNTPVLLPEKWLSLGEAADQTDSTPADAFYVLSNEESFYGAAAILYSKHLSETARKLGKDLLVLPTSVHEMIVIPEGEQPIGILTQLFRELLVSESRPEDVLSRSIYRLDHVTGDFSIAAHSD